MRNLGCAVCGEVETETEKNLSTLLQLVSIRYFMDAKLLAAHGAFSASISQRVQFRPFPTIRAQEVPRSVAMGRAHFLLEVR